MSPQDFIKNELNGYKEQSKITNLIYSIVELPRSFTLEFSDSSFYGTTWTGWGAIIHFCSKNKIDGYLVHELLHADLYKQGFPFHEQFYVNNDNSFLKGLISEETNRDIFNVLGHRIFYEKYESLGFANDEFVDSSKDKVNHEDLCTNFYVHDLGSVGSFISKYFEVSCDMRNNRALINRSILTMLRETSLDLFTSLDGLTYSIINDPDYRQISNYLNSFYDTIYNLVIPAN